jgi:NIPSNAP
MIVELRQYMLHPGMRDVLIELFDREFIETQESVGMQVLGQFRDLDDPNRFVWLRGFADMQARAAGLAAFYGGPVWAKHRAAANATMIDSDNVLLLRPVRPVSSFQLPAQRELNPAHSVHASIYYFDVPIAAELVNEFEQHLSAVDAALGLFVTDPSPNNFPALPVREDENVLVWFGRAPARELPDHLLRQLRRAPELHTLAPTTRSRLRG